MMVVLGPYRHVVLNGDQPGSQAGWLQWEMIPDGECPAGTPMAFELKHIMNASSGTPSGFISRNLSSFLP